VPHIFISYSRHERNIASLLASRLTEAGYNVWWDAALLGGTRFEDEIKLVLQQADVAIILWSKAAAASDWVRAEAELARINKSALPVVIDDVDPAQLPMLFQQIHAINLRDWTGNEEAEGYQQILKSVSTRAGRDAGPKLSPVEAHTKLRQASDEAAAWAELNSVRHIVPADYRSYLKRFPESQFKTIAEMRLERLLRQRARHWSIVGPTAIVALACVIGTAITFRPDLVEPITDLFSREPPPACVPAADIVKAPIGHFIICQDASNWADMSGNQATFVERYAKDGGMKLFLRTGEVTPDPDKRLSLILEEANGMANTTPDGKSAVVRTSSELIGDRLWYVWKYTRPERNGKVENNLVYYYKDEAYGFVELTVYSDVNGFEALEPYASKLIKTAQFK
jgi:hypothetical protein